MKKKVKTSFGQLKIPVKFLINTNLKALRLIEPLNFSETHYWRFRQTYYFENK